MVDHQDGQTRTKTPPAVAHGRLRGRQYARQDRNRRLFPEARTANSCRPARTSRRRICDISIARGSKLCECTDFFPPRKRGGIKSRFTGCGQSRQLLFCGPQVRSLVISPAIGANDWNSVATQRAMTPPSPKDRTKRKGCTTCRGFVCTPCPARTSAPENSPATGGRPKSRPDDKSSN